MVKDLGGVRDPSQLAAGFSAINGQGITLGPRTTIAGQPVQELEKPNEQGAGYVSVSARPELVRLWDPSKNGGTLTFTSYDQPVHIVAPPASETLDGAQYGM